MDFILGVDPSAKKIALVGTCPTLHSTLIEAITLYKTGKQEMKHLGDALLGMQQFLEAARPLTEGVSCYAWVEQPMVRGGTESALKQAYISGIIRATLVTAGFRVYNANVMTWKKEVCGNGRAEKSDVARAVRTQWPKVVDRLDGDGDLTDAAAIALYGQAVLTRSRTP